nr:hypothetical protein CFP56_78577 [Quercus suber]
MAPTRHHPSTVSPSPISLGSSPPPNSLVAPLTSNHATNIIMLAVTTAIQTQAKSTSGALQLSHVSFEPSEAFLKESYASFKPLPGAVG